jgi:hypothetical protein
LRARYATFFQNVDSCNSSVTGGYCRIQYIADINVGILRDFVIILYRLMRYLDYKNKLLSITSSQKHSFHILYLFTV